MLYQLSYELDPPTSDGTTIIATARRALNRLETRAIGVRFPSGAHHLTQRPEDAEQDAEKKFFPKQWHRRLADLRGGGEEHRGHRRDADATISGMFGSHLSIAGGMHNALLDAEKLGLDTVQVFTKGQKQWACKPLEAAAVAEWSEQLNRLNFKNTVSHDSYLINLASADETLWNKSVDAFTIEVERCDALGIPFLVTHPGAHLGTGEAAGLKRVIKGVDAVHQRLKKSRTITCLEITAGQGSSLGYTLEHLATIQDGVKAPERLGVCLDTAHLFAAGYDFRGRKYAAFKKQLEKTVGVDAVKVLHLNDSKKPLGSRVDRHEHIGLGTIGFDGFRPFVRDNAFRHVPKILETEKGIRPDGRLWDAVNLDVLRSLME